MVDASFHFIHEQIKNGKLEIGHCKSESQLAHVLTKPLKHDRFKNLRQLIGVVNVIESLA